MRSLRSVAVGLASVGLVSGLLLSGASAAAITARHTVAPLRAGGLTPAERRALRIVSVQAVGAEPAGLVVTITFAGNIEQALGRGHLKTGLVAVVLSPKTAGFAKADVATRGAGAIGETLRKTRSTDVGVVRDGNKLLFFVGGPGSSNVGKVQVKAFAAAPARSKRGIASGTLDHDYWVRVETAVATSEEDAAAIDAGLSKASCPSLIGAYKHVLTDAARARLRQGDLRDLIASLDAAIARAEKASGNGALLAAGLAHTILGPIGLAQKLLTGNSPIENYDTWKAMARGLKLDRRLVDAYLERNQKLIDNLALLQVKLERVIREECQEGGPRSTDPPPQRVAIHAAFDQATRSTLYTEAATGVVATYTWSVSIPTDPDCATGFTGNSPEPNQATWFHADKTQGGSCNHDGLHVGPRGHPGIVTVIVSNRNWSCKATYDGTEGPNGAAEGDGPPPPDCTPR